MMFATFFHGFDWSRFDLFKNMTYVSALHTNKTDTQSRIFLFLSAKYKSSVHCHKKLIFINIFTSVIQKEKKVIMS